MSKRSRDTKDPDAGDADAAGPKRLKCAAAEADGVDASAGAEASGSVARDAVEAAGARLSDAVAAAELAGAPLWREHGPLRLFVALPLRGSAHLNDMFVPFFPPRMVTSPHTLLLSTALLAAEACGGWRAARFGAANAADDWLTSTFVPLRDIARTVRWGDEIEFEFRPLCSYAVFAVGHVVQPPTAALALGLSVAAAEATAVATASDAAAAMLGRGGERQLLPTGWVPSDAGMFDAWRLPDFANAPAAYWRPTATWTHRYALIDAADPLTFDPESPAGALVARAELQPNRDDATAAVRPASNLWVVDAHRGTAEPHRWSTAGEETLWRDCRDASRARSAFWHAYVTRTRTWRGGALRALNDRTPLPAELQRLTAEYLPAGPW